MTTVAWKRILNDWNAGAGPLYERLALALRSAVERREVPPDTQLPPERTLAGLLKLSRTTVVAAYDQLRSEGLLDSRQGSGTYVRRSALHGAASLQERQIAGAFRRNMVFRGLLENPGSTIEFLAAHLSAPPELADEIRRVAEEEAEALCQGHGYSPVGLPALRKAVAQHLTRCELPTKPEQILITNGAQQAIGLTGALFIERGDTVAIENPTYLGAIDVFTAAGARFAPVAMTTDGVDVRELREVLAHDPRLIYLMPTFHNPTGVVVPERARREIVRLVEEHQIPLVEDHTLSDLVLESSPPPPLAAYAPKAPIMTIGSMSKLFWGGLRVGWIRGPEALIERLARFKAVFDLGSPLLNQAIAARLLPRAGTLQRTRRREVNAKLDRLTSALSAKLPDWTWRRPEGGLLLWAHLPRGNAADFAQIALRHGVAIVPGVVNSPDNSFTAYVRLPFVLDPKTLAEGIDRLAQAWSEFQPRTVARRAELGVIV
jgi:DNA-binding transcriptional MocR family regulator